MEISGKKWKKWKFPEKTILTQLHLKMTPQLQCRLKWHVNESMTLGYTFQALALCILFLTLMSGFTND